MWYPTEQSGAGLFLQSTGWSVFTAGGKEQQRGILPQQEVMGLLCFSSKKKSFLIFPALCWICWTPNYEAHSSLQHSLKDSVFLHQL